MMRRLFAVTAMGLGLLSTGMPALAKAPRPELEWRAFEDSSGKEMPDDRLQGEVRLRGQITSDKGVESWKVDAAPAEGASYKGFGTVCEGAGDGGGRAVEVDCDWDTATYPGKAPSTNDRYRLRVSARIDGEQVRVGKDRVVTLANLAAEPRDVRLAYDEAKQRLSLSWTANPEPDVAHYVIEERVNSKPWKQAGQQETTSWEQVAPEPGTYRYRVSAVRRVGEKGRTDPGPAAKPESPGRIVVKEAGPSAPDATADDDNTAESEKSPGGVHQSAGPEPAAGGVTHPTPPAPEKKAAPTATPPPPHPTRSLLAGMATPQLRRPSPTRSLSSGRPRPAPVPAPDPGYSLSLPYRRPPAISTTPAVLPAATKVAASRTTPARDRRRGDQLPLGLPVLAASFLGLMAGFLHIGRSSLANRCRQAPAVPAAGGAGVGALRVPAPGPATLEERMRRLREQWRGADTETRLELLGDMLDIQLEFVSAFGSAGLDAPPVNGSFGKRPILSAVAEK
jgi:hypothetical protein